MNWTNILNALKATWNGVKVAFGFSSKVVVASVPVVKKTASAVVDASVATVNVVKANPKTVGIAVGAVALALVAIKGFEGLRTHAYHDATGTITVCYGETEGVKITDHYTKKECAEKLSKKVVALKKAMDKLIKVKVNDNTEAAMLSFTYNVGLTNFKNSTVLKKLNKGDTVGACNYLPKYIYSKGVELPGLKNRRALEQKMCLTGV